MTDEPFDPFCESFDKIVNITAELDHYRRIANSLYDAATQRDEVKALLSKERSASYELARQALAARVDAVEAEALVDALVDERAALRERLRKAEQALREQARDCLQEKLDSRASLNIAKEAALSASKALQSDGDLLEDVIHRLVDERAALRADRRKAHGAAVVASRVAVETREIVHSAIKALQSDGDLLEDVIHRLVDERVWKRIEADDMAVELKMANEAKDSLFSLLTDRSVTLHALGHEKAALEEKVRQLEATRPAGALTEQLEAYGFTPYVVNALMVLDAFGGPTNDTYLDRGPQYNWRKAMRHLADLGSIDDGRDGSGMDHGINALCRVLMALRCRLEKAPSCPGKRVKTPDGRLYYSEALGCFAHEEEE